MKKVLVISLWATIIVVMLDLSFAFGWYDVCIDPGHGGTDAGCIGRLYGVMEKDVNFGVGHTAWTYFGLANYNVIMTRDEDTTPTRRGSWPF